MHKIKLYIDGSFIEARCSCGRMYEWGEIEKMMESLECKNAYKSTPKRRFLLFVERVRNKVRNRFRAMTGYRGW